MSIDTLRLCCWVAAALNEYQTGPLSLSHSSSFCLVFGGMCLMLCGWIDRWMCILCCFVKVGGDMERVEIMYIFISSHILTPFFLCVANYVWANWTGVFILSADVTYCNVIHRSKMRIYVYDTIVATVASPYYSIEMKWSQLCETHKSTSNLYV